MLTGLGKKYLQEKLKLSDDMFPCQYHHEAIISCNALRQTRTYIYIIIIIIINYIGAIIIYIIIIIIYYYYY